MESLILRTHAGSTRRFATRIKPPHMDPANTSTRKLLSDGPGFLSADQRVKANENRIAAARVERERKAARRAKAAAASRAGMARVARLG